MGSPHCQQGRGAIKRRKKYLQIRDSKTGKRLLAHRVLAELLLGRPLLPREIVHHRDGDSTNNAFENLLVLPSQRYHAHAEFHLRREKMGMPSLFPELFQGIKHPTSGGLFDCLLTLQVQEPPLPVRKVVRGPIPFPDCEPLLSIDEQSSLARQSLILPDTAPAHSSGARRLQDLLAHFQVQIVDQQQVTLIPLQDLPPHE